MEVALAAVLSSVLGPVRSFQHDCSHVYLRPYHLKCRFGRMLPW